MVKATTSPMETIKMLFIMELRVYIAMIMNMVTDAIRVAFMMVSRLLYIKNYGTIKNLSINVISKAVPRIADNMVNTYLQKLLDKKKPKTLGTVLNILKDIHEYYEGEKIGIGPKILLGDKKKAAGRIFVDMTGGTEGSKRVFARLSQIGIGTLVCMHLSEAHFKLAKKEHINIVIAGHIPSDSIGLNLILDEVMKKEMFNIIPCSGFIRHSRK